MLHNTLINNTQVKHELTVLRRIIEQLNQFSNKHEVAEISRNIIAIMSGKKVNLGRLRSQILEIYYKEQYPGKYNIQFYSALFSLLLLLAKYNPTNRRTKEGTPECPAALTKIDSQSRLLTTSGIQLDLQTHKPWFNENSTNPFTREELSERELNYLYSRIENLSQEIPSLVEPQKESLYARFKTYIKREFVAAGMTTALMYAGSQIAVTLAASYFGKDMVNLLDVSMSAMSVFLGPLLGVYVAETVKRVPHISVDQNGQLLSHIQKLGEESRANKNSEPSSTSSCSKRLEMIPSKQEDIQNNQPMPAQEQSVDTETANPAATPRPVRRGNCR